MRIKFICIGLIVISIMGCGDLAVMTTPKKTPVASQNELTNTAEKVFWDTLHQGQYDNIAYVTKLLTAVYLQNPNDPKIAAHLGFLYIWKIAERNRLKNIDPTVVNNTILAKKYFSDAVELDPGDARYLGFLGVSQLVEGTIFNDQREQTRGYFTLKQAISAWPQFNYFTAGYPMSNLPANTEHFKEGLEWQWKTLDICAGQTVDRNNPGFGTYMKYETQQGPQRACWNSWIAPYNFEGFFLNMGDMLVKQGNWQVAIKIYNNAKLAKNYSTWPYRWLLEDRIQHAQENVVAFNKLVANNQLVAPKKVIVFNSGYGCMMCHQKN